MSAQSNNQLASERREKNEVNQIKCQNKKLSKSKPEINAGSKLKSTCRNTIYNFGYMYKRYILILKSINISNQTYIYNGPFFIFCYKIHLFL